MKILSLNCQKAYHPALEPFLKKTLASGEYDFLLLQEATEPVLMSMSRTELYHFLRPPEDNPKNQLCIAYRNSYTLVLQEFHPFAHLRFDPVAGYEHRGYGLLLVLFNFEGDKICIGSIHTHAGVSSAVRVIEIKLMKEAVMKFAQGSSSIIAGDCNFGYPGELSRAARLLAPEITCVTRRLGGTLNSRYSEYANHLPNKIAVALAKFGLGVKLKTDHFFVNRAFAESAIISCRILPDRVSDHSPIELVFERR